MNHWLMAFIATLVLAACSRQEASDVKESATTAMDAETQNSREGAFSQFACPTVDRIKSSQIPTSINAFYIATTENGVSFMGYDIGGLEVSTFKFMSAKIAKLHAGWTLQCRYGDEHAHVTLESDAQGQYAVCELPGGAEQCSTSRSECQFSCRKQP